MAVSEDIHDKYWQEYWELKARVFAPGEELRAALQRSGCLTKEIHWLDAGCDHILT